MGEMVERVARAIGPYLRDLWDSPTTAQDVARMAIEAMREPTEAMNDAADREDAHTLPEGADGATHWRAMIDAALKD